EGFEVTPAVDVFAWGCLVAFAGNGRHPFGTGDAVTLAARVLHAEPDLGDLPESLRALVIRALHRDPARRPSAYELLLALAWGRLPHEVPEPPGDAAAYQVLTTHWHPPAT